MVIEQKFKAGEEPDPTEYLFISMEMKRKDQTKPYDAKKACWVPDDNHGFWMGEITGTKGEQITVKTPEGERAFKKDLVNQVNPPKYEKCEDMSNLTFLNDASVLHNLKERYVNKYIYTYSGLFCIAINPYKRYPIYTSRAMKIYHSKRRNEVPPHIFAIADGAYTEMQLNTANQSILITGESGAGKTENTKKVIAYFASVGASEKKETVKKISLEDQIVQTNPVLESFGNAKTTRNDNSSRFGKFIRIHFTSTGRLAGADIETYLLEKARVVSQMAAERSYHIFYQIISGKVPGIKEMCLLSNDIYDYHFVSQGKITIAGIDDGEECEMTHEAFEILGFSKIERENIYKITAAVMHMGEMKFKSKGDQAEPDGTDAGKKAATLLGVGADEMYVNITKPRIKVGTEFVTKGQNGNQCTNSISAMAKALFDRLFVFLVKICNHTLDAKMQRANFIGVLDIAGFEIFDYNGFEQLCINFTNEKLQQFFNHHMFVLEQEEYKKEGLDWIFEDFGMDLQACIEMMERPMGIFAILEEQSMFPKATDQTFADMLNANHLGKSVCYAKPKPAKPGQEAGHFSCAHYAGTVPYSVTGWLEKNKDPLNDSLVDQFKKGSNELVKSIFADHPGQSGGKDDGGGGKKKKGGFKTVSSSYREQLNSLMTTLKATHPHFIRCIVPNEVKTPGLVDSGLVMHQLTCNGVLEGIRICRKGFPNRMLYPDFFHRYQILAAAEMAAEKEEKASATACFDKVGLTPDTYRVGHTKVFFKAGILGSLEEIRDDKIGKLIAQLQSTIRLFQVKKAYKSLQDQRLALEVVQRNIRSFMRLKSWPWWSLWKIIKPKLNVTQIEDIIKKIEEKIAKSNEGLAAEQKLTAELLKVEKKYTKDRDDVIKQFDDLKGSAGSMEDKLAKINSQKNDLQRQLGDAEIRLQNEEEARNQLQQQKKRVENELSTMRKDLEENASRFGGAENDITMKTQLMVRLNEEILQQEELISKMQKEKKIIQESKQATEEGAQVQEDQLKNLTRIKTKLEGSLDELEDSLEREKKLRGDVEKTKKKVEGDLRLCQEAVADLERHKKELEQGVQRKEKEIFSLNAKMEDEASIISKYTRQIKELHLRVEELEEELEAERQSRSKAEKKRAQLARELQDLGSNLEEAGCATSNQIELNKKREAELAKLRHEVEEANVQHEASLSMLRKKHNDSISEMAEQIENVNKVKAKVEKDRAQIESELTDLRAQMNSISNDKAGQERMCKSLQHQIGEISGKYNEVMRNFGECDNTKRKLAMDNTEMSRQLEEAESNLSQLSKLKVSMTTQLTDTKRGAEEEARERAILLGKFRNVEHDIDVLREQLECEAENKGILQQQIAKGNSDAQIWKSKYETEGLSRIEELEEAKHKLQARLCEAEETIESLNQKSLAIEKIQQRLSTQLEDMHSEVDRSRALVIQMEKKQAHFDKINREWQQKVNDISAELDASQQDTRRCATEMFRLKATHDEILDRLESTKRENKNLTEEIKDLLDQIANGGRNIHEIEKQRNRLQVEKEEIQSALEEAESALEQEENKVLRVNLELSQLRQEIDRRIQEKEEEFENTRKNHQSAISSMQASLDSEVNGKTEALRIKKKLETDINELEITLDHANKANADSQKLAKKYINNITENQTMLEEEQRARDELREQVGIAERRANAISNELEESRTLLEQAERARRSSEQEVHDARDQLNEMAIQSSNLSKAKRAFEGEMQILHADLEQLLNESKSSEEKAKKAMIDAARLADELRTEQEHSANQDRQRKAFEIQIKEFQAKLEEAEANALKGGRKIIAKLEEKIRALEQEVDIEQRRHAECLKNVRKSERRTKELCFQAEEDQKNLSMMSDLTDKLQQMIKTYKRQIEEAEEIAALNLAKYRKSQQELEEVDERIECAENNLKVARSKGRMGSVM